MLAFRTQNDKQYRRVDVFLLIVDDDATVVGRTGGSRAQLLLALSVLLRTSTILLMELYVVPGTRYYFVVVRPLLRQWGRSDAPL